VTTVPVAPETPVVAVPAAIPRDEAPPAKPLPETPLDVFSAPNARVKLLEVRRTDTMANAAETSLTVVVGLARPELQLDEPDNIEGRLLAVDLPKPLQTRLFYASEPDDAERERGTLCDRPRFPHECDLGRFSAADVGRRERRQLLKLTFEDGAYAAVPITVPVPPALPIPELVEPTSVPAQAGAIAFAFRDVGADEYELTVSACHRYRNDGINPCLDESRIYLVRGPGGLVAATRPERTSLLVAASGDRVVVRLDVPLHFEESVSYGVTALKRGTLRGVGTRTRSATTRTFLR